MAHKDVFTSKEAVSEAQKGWDRFVNVSKYGIICVVIVLALMALFLT